MSRRDKAFWVVLVILAVSAGLVWVAYQQWGHLLIRRLLDRGVVGASDGYGGGGDRPLDYYLARADLHFRVMYRIMLALGVIVCVHLKFAVYRTRRMGARGVAFWAGALLTMGGPGLISKTAGAVVAALSLLPGGSPLRIAERRTFLLLLTAFGFAFLLTPYWMLARPAWARAALAVALGAAGWWWAHAAAGAVALPALARGERAWVVLVAAVLVVLNLRAIGVDIPWHGDEDYHMEQVLYLVRSPYWLAALGVAAGTLALARTESRSAVVTSALMLAVMFVLCGGAYGHLLRRIARYPYFSRWFQAVPVQCLFLARGWLYQEAVLRLPALLSALALAGLVYLAVRSGPRPLRALFALAVGTTPLLSYYSTVLYLELPAIVLLTVVCLRSKEMLEADAAELRRDVGWPCLLAAGLVKETLVPFLGAWLLCRGLVALAKRPRFRTVVQESVLAVVVVLPVAVYLGFRVSAHVYRVYGCAWGNLLDGGLYRLLLVTWFDQFGLLLLLFPAGLAVLLRARGPASTVFHLATILATMAFHMADKASYVGDSRFNLLCLPALISCAVLAMDALTRWRVAAGWAAAIALLVANVLLSPVNPDGTRETGWGCPAGGGEQYYPYRAALLWLKAAHPHEKILFANPGYRYYFDFYFRKFGWRPDHGEWTARMREHDDQERLETILQHADENGFDIMVYPVSDEVPAGQETLHNFRMERAFRNDARTVAVFRRQGGATLESP